MALPVRTCISCRAKRPKHELLRVTLAPGGSLAVDHRQRLPGRGAYVCADRPGCQQQLKPEALARTLKAPVSAHARQQLQAALTMGV